MSTKSKAAIHDLSYQRYLGSRRNQSSRWQTIVKNLIATTWKGWWRYRIWLISSVLITSGIAIAMYFSRDEIFNEAIIGGMVRSAADALPAMSIAWYGNVAFIATLAGITPIISRDLRAGAFQFYFSRPVRPRDYLLGKIAGALLLMVPFMLVGPLLLACIRVGLSKDSVYESIQWIPKSLVVGLVGTWIYAILPLAFGAFFQKPKSAGGLWALFVLIISGLARAISHGVDVVALQAISPFTAVTGIAFRTYDVTFRSFGTDAPLWSCVVSVCVYSVLAVGILVWRINSSYRSGVGSA